MRRVLASLMVAVTLTGSLPALAAPVETSSPIVPQPGPGEHFLLVQNSKGDIRHGPIWQRNRAGAGHGFRGFRGREFRGDYGRRWHHRGWRHGRHYGWRGGDNGGAVAAGIAGVAAGALIGSALANRSRGPGGSSCAERFRSYDPSTGTYMGYDGQRHSCP